MVHHDLIGKKIRQHEKERADLVEILMDTTESDDPQTIVGISDAIQRANRDLARWKKLDSFLEHYCSK